MDKIVSFKYKNCTLYGVKNSNQLSKSIVIFLHGIPGERVDSRRLPVKISRVLNQAGINTLRVDLYATSFSEGSYAEVTFALFKDCIISIIRQIQEEDEYKKIILVAFSEAGKIALKVQDEVQIDGICFCNAIIAKEEKVTELGVNRYFRRDQKFVIDIGFGVWINVNLIKEINDWCYLMEKIPQNDYLFIYGTGDQLTANTLKMIKCMDRKLVLLDKEDHLFTSGKNDMRIASEIATWINDREVLLL